MSKNVKPVFLRVRTGRPDGQVSHGCVQELGFQAQGQTVIRGPDASSVLVVNADPDYTSRIAAKYGCTVKDESPNLGVLSL